MSDQAPTKRDRQKTKSSSVKDRSRQVSRDAVPEDGSATKSESELLETLPPEIRQRVARIIMAETSHSGPLPSAAELQRYQAILPGLVERIVGMAEKEQENRHKVDNRSISAYNLRNSFSFVLGIGLIGSSIIALLLGYPMTAIPLGIIGVVGAILNTIIKVWTRTPD